MLSYAPLKLKNNMRRSRKVPQKAGRRERAMVEIPHRALREEHSGASNPKPFRASRGDGVAARYAERACWSLKKRLSFCSKLGGTADFAAFVLK